MTVKTSASFDLDTFRRGYEEWDVEALLGLYADDVELIQIDRDNPPSSPRTRHGSDVFRGMLEHCAAAGVRATVENAVAGEDRAAATVTCEFPGGRKVWRTRSWRSRAAASSVSWMSCQATQVRR